MVADRSWELVILQKAGAQLQCDFRPFFPEHVERQKVLGSLAKPIVYLLRPLESQGENAPLGAPIFHTFRSESVVARFSSHRFFINIIGLKTITWRAGGQSIESRWVSLKSRGSQFEIAVLNEQRCLAIRLSSLLPDCGSEL
ncbi:MAG TPA: hypothetical protein VE959_13530 [Bryobacteraceae bacterium]|nr:hypothetical protein [Bryobacteraceae bacterium]